MSGKSPLKPSHTVAQVITPEQQDAWFALLFAHASITDRIDRDLHAAANLAVGAEQHHAQARDLDARGPVINASRGDGSAPHPRVGATSPADGRTPPPHQ